MAEALADLGEIALLEARLADAGSYLEEALALYEAFDDRQSLLRVLAHLGELARRQGDHAGSRSILDRCLALAHELDSRHAEAWALTQLARLARAEGDSGRRAVPGGGSAGHRRGVPTVGRGGGGARRRRRRGRRPGRPGDGAPPVRRRRGAARFVLSGRWRSSTPSTMRLALRHWVPEGYDRARTEGAAMTAAARRQLVRTVQVG